MDDEARATGLDPVPDRRPGTRAPAGPAVAVSASPPRWRRAGRGRTGSVRPDLCRARSRHQQLPAAGRASDPRQLSRGRRVLPHHPAGRRHHQSGRLSEAAILRAVDALRVCRDKMRNRGVTRSRLIATEACRAAENGVEFLERMRDEVGLELEIVDRETEARLAATGCTPLLDPRPRASSCSTSAAARPSSCGLGLLRPSGRPAASDIVAWISMPIGVVTLAERHGGVTVTREIYEAMVAEVADYVDVSPRARRHGGAAPARHFRHRDHDRRRASRADALRSPPRRRLLDDRRRRSPA